MKLSIKVYYGLQALLELAENPKQGPLNMKIIAKRQTIPLNFLEQILNTLKKNGVVKSNRGKEGGYALAKQPSDITCYEVVLALSGRPKILDKEVEKPNAIDNFLLATEINLIKYFQSKTLEELKSEDKKLRDVVDFTI
ncbi:MAG: Rrf2 family transcriptional regulator [bacterium]